MEKEAEVQTNLNEEQSDISQLVNLTVETIKLYTIPNIQPNSKLNYLEIAAFILPIIGLYYLVVCLK